MTTSNSFELTLRGDRDILFTRVVDALEVPFRAKELALVRADEPFAVSVRRSVPDNRRLRVRLGTEVIAVIAAGAAAGETPLDAWLRNEFGECLVAIDREVEDDVFEPLVEIGLAVTPRPEVVHDYHVMIEDVAQVHQGLAQDVIGRSVHKGGWGDLRASLLQPETTLRHLERLYARFGPVLAQIARQPSVLLEGVVRPARYRGGDRTDSRAVAGAVRDPQLRLDGRRIRALGKVLVRSPRVSDDLPEHRHIAEGIRRLAARADSLVRHCQRAADLLQREESRWSLPTGGRLSVFEQRDLPRIHALHEIASQGQQLAAAFRQLLDQHAFLANAGPPRTRFGSTPAFLGRSAYREVYRLLVEARQVLGLLVDADVVRIYYRDLATLFEYWCFLRTVGLLRQRFGRSSPQQNFVLIDDIYRPELAPGQQFRFEIGRGASVTVTYQAEIRPWKLAAQRGDRYGASFTGNPLRPDILLEIARPNVPPAMLVLDAKSSDYFSPIKFREMTDYSRQVFDLHSGRQPIRQVFLLHRDRNARPLSNLPGYLQGRSLDPANLILGAIPCVPEKINSTPPLLAEVVERFLKAYT